MDKISVIRQKMIEKAEEEFYRADSDLYYMYNDAEVKLEDALESILKENKIHTYSIEVETLFESPGIDVGYVSFAWLENGELFHITFGTVLC